MEETKKKNSIVKYLMAAAACLILLAGGGLGAKAYRLSYTVASTISLEVNPGIEITVNKKERVLDVKALNKDGEIVIGDMDFSGSDINVVINALIGSMLRNGYLNELANSILISVDNEDPAEGAALQEKLTKEVNDLLASDGFFGAVISQTLVENADLRKQADRYGITLGKAQLIEQILSSAQGHTFEELAPLSINELNLLLTKAGTDTDKVSAMGNASDKAYIGEGKALETALAHAGISEEDIMVYKMDMDVENGVMVYEMEFEYEGHGYEYDIDARTGEILKNKKEIREGGTTDADHEKYVPESSASVDGTADHYYYEPEHHYEPEHDGSYNNSSYNNSAYNNNSYNNSAYNNSSYNNGSHHNDKHHDGAYYNGNTGNTGNTSASITVDQAKAAALAHAGLSADSVYFEKAELDYDDGVLVYEIEFSAGSVEYEYEIDAQTGDILDHEWDRH